MGGNWGRSEINRGKDLDKIIKKKRGNVWEKKELGPEGEGMRQSGGKKWWVGDKKERSGSG